jgi:hypothetical protein
LVFLWQRNTKEFLPPIISLKKPVQRGMTFSYKAQKDSHPSYAHPNKNPSAIKQVP